MGALSCGVMGASLVFILIPTGCKQRGSGDVGQSQVSSNGEVVKDETSFHSRSTVAVYFEDEEEQEISKKSMQETPLCSGVIVSSHHVLTVTHCFFDSSGLNNLRLSPRSTKNMFVGFGADQSKNKAKTIRTVKRVSHFRNPEGMEGTYLFPNFEGSLDGVRPSIVRDLTILELEKAIPSGFNPAPLTKEDPSEKLSFVSSGFGLSPASLSKGEVAEDSEIPWVIDGLMRKVEGFQREESWFFKEGGYFCLRPPEKGGISGGDSGGPIYESSGELVGITSHMSAGVDCFVDLKARQNWILNQLQPDPSKSEVEDLVVIKDPLGNHYTWPVAPDNFEMSFVFSAERECSLYRKQWKWDDSTSEDRKNSEGCSSLIGREIKIGRSRGFRSVDFTKDAWRLSGKEGEILNVYWGMNRLNFSLDWPGCFLSMDFGYKTSEEIFDAAHFLMNNNGEIRIDYETESGPTFVYQKDGRCHEFSIVKAAAQFGGLTIQAPFRR